MFTLTIEMMARPLQVAMDDSGMRTCSWACSKNSFITLAALCDLFPSETGNGFPISNFLDIIEHLEFVGGATIVAVAAVGAGDDGDDGDDDNVIGDWIWGCWGWFW